MFKFSLRAICVVVVSVTVFATIPGASAQSQGTDRVVRIIEAHGGAAALNRVAQVEADWAGYSIGRHQSRQAEPLYDRLPIRSWFAFDLSTGRSAMDSIGTYPGELNLGYRDVNDGKRGWSLNTISRIYSPGSMHAHEDIVAFATSRMPWLLVRKMIAEPGAFKPVGTRARRGIVYDLFSHGSSTIWVNPQTSLIHAISSQGSTMADATMETTQTYTDYFKQDGVMINRGHQVWTGDEVTRDMQLYSLRFNHPVDEHLRIPDGFVEVASMDGYNGVATVGVERIGQGVFLAGSGDTRVLYVEFADHFVAMEAGGMPDYAEQTYNAMRPHMKGKPLRTIIPTHHHDDHAVALSFYAGPAGATILTTRDKEGMIRGLLARPWDKFPAVKNAKFAFVDEPRMVLEDRTNRLEVHRYQDAPHTENMLVGYLGREATLYTCDVFIGWVGDVAGNVRQGASYGAKHLARWVAARQKAGNLGAIKNYPSCHGRAYSSAEFEGMLTTERAIVSLPGNTSWPSANWFDRYGLSDDTSRNPRREHVLDSAGPR